MTNWIAWISELAENYRTATGHRLTKLGLDPAAWPSFADELAESHCRPSEPSVWLGVPHGEVQVSRLVVDSLVQTD